MLSNDNSTTQTNKTQKENSIKLKFKRQIMQLILGRGGKKQEIQQRKLTVRSHSKTNKYSKLMLRVYAEENK